MSPRPKSKSEIIILSDLHSHPHLDQAPLRPRSQCAHHARRIGPPLHLLSLVGVAEEAVTQLSMISPERRCFRDDVGNVKRARTAWRSSSPALPSLLSFTRPRDNRNTAVFGKQQSTTKREHTLTYLYAQLGGWRRMVGGSGRGERADELVVAPRW
jgi:hypothetical protein